MTAPRMSAERLDEIRARLEAAGKCVAFALNEDVSALARHAPADLTALLRELDLMRVDATAALDAAARGAKAQKAVMHLMRRVVNTPELAYWIGHGSESLDLLTQGYAEVTGRPLADVREEVDRNVRGVRPSCRNCECERCKEAPNAAL